MAVLNALVTAPGTFNLRLYTNNVNWNSGIVLGGVSEATFSGYAAVPLNFPNPASIGLSGLGQILADLAVFVVGAGGVTNLINGYYITYDDGSTHVLVFGEQLPTAPIQMVNPGDEIDLSVTMQDGTA